MITPEQYDYLEKRYAQVWKELREVQKQERKLADELWRINQKLREPIKEETK